MFQMFYMFKGKMIFELLTVRLLLTIFFLKVELNINFMYSGEYRDTLTLAIKKRMKNEALRSFIFHSFLPSNL